MISGSGRLAPEVQTKQDISPPTNSQQENLPPSNSNQICENSTTRSKNYDRDLSDTQPVPAPPAETKFENVEDITYKKDKIEDITFSNSLIDELD